MSLVCLSSANCLQTFLWIIFRRGFLLGRQPCRPIWCSVQRMVWALTGCPPTPSTPATVLAALIRLFSKEDLWIWCWARVLYFFGRTWQSVFWVEPVLLNHCMVLATMRCHVELPVTSMRACESDDTKFNTPAPQSHLRPRNTNESYDTREGKWLIGPNLDIFT